MKIAYVITRGDAVGGATIHVRDIAGAMRERGHDPLILVGGSGPATDLLASSGIRVEVLPHLCRAPHPVLDMLAFAELTRALRNFSPDLVSTHTAKAGALGRAAAAYLGLPAVHTPHGLPLRGRFSAPAAWLFARSERLSARWCRAIVCVSEAERQLGLAHRIAPPDRMVVIHNGVRDVPAELRARPEREPLRICSVARLERPKDFATLITALGQIKNREWTLDLVGDGPLEAHIRSLAAGAGLANRVPFLGYVPDPAKVYAEAGMFVLVSRSEAFPRSILEAMRAGLPLVASNVGGIPEAVDHGVTGVLVPPRDAPALAEAIAALQASPERRAEMGAQARAAFAARFRLEQTVEKTLTLYQSLVSVSTIRT